MKSITIELPYPPSVNHYWRMVRTRYGCRMIISDKGQAFRMEVDRLLRSQAECKPFDGSVGMHVILHPPDRRVRDIDNTLKATCDALEHAKLIENDSQIEWLLVERSHVIHGGKVIITIRERDCADAASAVSA